MQTKYDDTVAVTIKRNNSPLYGWQELVNRVSDVMWEVQDCDGEGTSGADFPDVAGDDSVEILLHRHFTKSAHWAELVNLITSPAIELCREIEPRATIQVI